MNKLSAARNLQHEVITNQGIRRRTRKKKSLAPDRVEYVKYKPRRMPRRFLFTVLLIFVAGISAAASAAMLQSVRHNIDRTQVAIQNQQEANIALRAVIHQHFTVEEIDQIARERLNMGPADASQIVRINVPRTNYVRQSEELGRFEPNPTMWQSAFNYLRTWLGV